ncbi:tRNA lysidine(34) synthetase TilS [Mycoplasmopsis columbinasalis]|uniref:tRNA(Ile)-lysidine synthase n=1 Tax=Mycoplasmopsis columbinasalis TaxID=114880 RepID=A0A449BAB3_9BACT|nr:tRNA lysidine(34) synthetase TilS [Mycoplasmopsis columbinasalis]VEU78125.1 tRNA(Ile)-lysidine synthase [Mycoplasmopsis columbinasalis]
MLYEERKILLGISGGPDSMYLLSWAMSQYDSSNLIVCTVNYNVRKDSFKDVEIVRKFCEKHKISFFDKQIFTSKEERYYNTNFENQAREDRLDFFYEIYKKFNCEMLLLGHHKDDFLETALMQQNAKKKRFYYGIKEKSILRNMLVYRPFLKMYFKNELLELCEKNQINYATDETNFLPITTRNKIRLELTKLSNNQKQKIIDEINELNKKNQIVNEEIFRIFAKWESSEFDQDEFKKLEYKTELIYIFINTYFQTIKLSSGKINNLVAFVLSNNRTNSFLLKDKVFLHKKRGKLLKPKTK